jgi:hypothetical protein
VLRLALPLGARVAMVMLLAVNTAVHWYTASAPRSTINTWLGLLDCIPDILIFFPKTHASIRFLAYSANHLNYPSLKQ